MMNINTYFNTILDTEGYDAWEDADAMVWSLYEADDDSFEFWASEHDIDLDAVRSCDGFCDGELELAFWVWEHED